MKSSGYRFYPNGDLLMCYHRPGRRPLILYQIFGLRGGEKVLLDSWCEEACPQCGCPGKRYHAMTCPLGKEH